MKHSHRHRRSAAAMGLAAIVLFACASPKPDRFYSLLPSEPPPLVADVAARVFIDVMPVSMPPLVDQPQWVVRAADDTLMVLEQERWAAPLRDELRSALTERLVARWGASDVHTMPQPVNRVWRVRLDVQRFESLPARESRIDGTWSLLPPQPGAPALVCRTTLHESVSEPGVPALAAAHRRAVARLADQIGAALQGLQRGEVVRCGE